MPRTALLPLVLLTVPAVAAAAEPDIWAAARNGDQARVEALLEAGVEVDAATRYDATALYFAAANGHLELVEYLLEKGADPNVRDAFYMRTPLSAAIGEGHPEVAVRLIESGAEDVLSSPLVLGVHSGERAVVEAVVARGPVYDFEKKAALELTREAGSEELAALVEKARVKAELATVELAPERLGELAGSYRGEGGTVEIVVREGRLHLSRAGGEAQREDHSEDHSEDHRLVALSPHHFRSPDDHDVGVVFVGRLRIVERLVLIKGSSPEAFRRISADAAGEELTDVPPAAPGGEPALPRSAAINWPSFRGPGASGIGDGQGVPTTWDVATGKNVLWKREVPGLAYSSPVVWGDRVFLTTAIATAGSEPEADANGVVGERTEHTWKVLALDKASGEVAWQASAGTAVPLTGRHGLSSQANSTPATDGERLVTVFPTVGMSCYSVDGELLWHKDLGALNAGNYFDASMHWGFAASPVLYEGTVILQADVHEGAFVAAYELETGRELWKTPREELSGWATPLVVAGPEGDELVTNASTIRGYDPRTGRELWRLAPNSEQVVPTPVAAGGLIYVTTGYPPAFPIYAVRPGQRGDLSLDPGDSKSSAVAWSHERGGAYMATPIVYRGLLYIANGGGRLAAYDASTGERLYRARLSEPSGFTNSPVAADGRLFFPTQNGPIVVVKAGPTYEELAVNDMGEQVMATPAISDGALLVRTLGNVYALSVESGDPRGAAASSATLDGR